MLPIFLGPFRTKEILSGKGFFCRQVWASHGAWNNTGVGDK